MTLMILLLFPVGLLPQVDEIYHLASPASPPHYMYNPIKTIKTNSQGTLNMLGLARRVNARMLLASTSEVCLVYPSRLVCVCVCVCVSVG